MLAGQLLVAALCAFSGPTARLGTPLGAPRTAPAAPTVIMMAGWNDPYQGSQGQKREKLEVDGTSFDQKMQEDAAKMSNMMYTGTAVMIAGILAVLIPLLNSQP